MLYIHYMHNSIDIHDYSANIIYLRYYYRSGHNIVAPLGSQSHRIVEEERRRKREGLGIIWELSLSSSSRRPSRFFLPIL